MDDKRREERARAVLAADERAHRIALYASEDLVRFHGEPTGGIDEFMILQSQADEDMRDRIAHLCWHGRAICQETDDGYLVVTLGDFTIGEGLWSP